MASELTWSSSGADLPLSEEDPCKLDAAGLVGHRNFRGHQISGTDVMIF
jgi:hypothetical protein